MARDVLVILTYPVDDFDTLRTVTDHQRRFYAISSLVDLVSVPYRTAQVSCPSCIMPFARCRIVQSVGFLVDAVNVHLTSMIAVDRFLGAAAAGARPKRNIYYNHGNGRKGRGQADWTWREDRRDDLTWSLSGLQGRCRRCAAQMFSCSPGRIPLQANVPNQDTGDTDCIEEERRGCANL